MPIDVVEDFVPFDPIQMMNLYRHLSPLCGTLLFPANLACVVVPFCRCRSFPAS